MNTAKTKVYAPRGKENKVFTYIGSGYWSASLYGRDVILERKSHDHWVCLDDATNKIVGEGPTRNDAMREAFYEEAEKKGYNAKEAVRLEWILESEIYRSYNGHKPRRKTVNKDAPKEYQKVTPIDRVTDEDVSQTSLNNIFKQYKTAYNKVLGGFFFYKRNEETGDIETGIHGPYKDEEQMFSAILECEASKLK